MQDGLEKSEDDPISQSKVHLSSRSLLSSVINESSKDVFEHCQKAFVSSSAKDLNCSPQLKQVNEAITPWRKRYYFADALSKSELIAISDRMCYNVSESKNEAEWSKQQIILAHNTFGHCGWEKAAEMAEVRIPAKWQPFCRICAATKLHRADKKKKRQELDPGKYAGDYLHIDLHGKVRDVTQNGMKYFAVIVDDFSGRLFALLLKRKKHLLERLDELIGRIQAETGHIVGRIKTDGDGIFCKQNEELQKVIKKHGFIHLLSTPYSSHFNGKAERSIGVIKEMARSMLFQSGLPRRYWGEAVIYAVQVLNRMPRKGVPGPFSCALSAWRGQAIDQPGRLLKPFGCEVWALDNKEAPKGASRRLTAQIGTPCIFLGLQTDKGSYRVLSLVHARVFNTVDVVFNPSSFPVAIKKNYVSDFDVLVEESQFCLERPDPSGGIEGSMPLSDELDGASIRPGVNPNLESSLIEMQAPAILQPFNTPGRLEGPSPISRARERAPSRQLLESFQAQVSATESEELWEDKVEKNALCYMIDILCESSKLSRSRVIHILNADHNN